jgi:hypothetical protein
MRWVFSFVLIAAGCRSSSDSGPVDAGLVQPSRPTTLSFSQRVPPARPPGQGSVTDGREKAQGEKLRNDVAAACKDDKQCRFSKCASLCSAWMQKAYAPGELRGSVQTNQVYINCTGSCIGPEPAAK